MQFFLVGSEGSSTITVVVPGHTPKSAQSDHPNFDKIRELALAGDESVIELFEPGIAAIERFERLTERVTYANGNIYFDGDKVANPIAMQILRFLEEDVDDWYPLVLFLENLQQNPNEHSREMLYTWLEPRDFTITQDGKILGYKGVSRTDGRFFSINRGSAIVDGTVVEGSIPNEIGSVIEMPRNSVQFDPSEGCSTGLHVGTWSYANSFGGGNVLEVHVNPRDVVSVPTDSQQQKMRVCRYEVVNIIEAPYSEPLVPFTDYLDGDEPEEDDDWGFLYWEDE